MSTIDSHAPGTPSWFDLMTPDIERARRFYGALFGWTFEIGGPETGHYSMALKDGRQAAGIGSMPEGSPYPTAWTVYFASTDADASAERVKALGGSVMMGPMDVAEEGRLVIVADPAGAVFGFWQPKRHKGAGVRDEPGSMIWCEANTRDIEKVRPFYAQLFGATAKKLEAPGMTYYTLDQGGPEFGGLNDMNPFYPPEVPSHWQAYFAVADTDASVKVVTDQGGKVFAPPMDTPYGRMAVVSDPSGAVFAIIQPAK